MNEHKPGVFAVSEDGRFGSYFYCPAEKCQSIGALSHKAISRCEKRSRNTPCHILAHRKNIVWKKSTGENYTYEELLKVTTPIFPKAFEEHIGKGYISLSDSTKQAFRKYMDTYNSGVFAITGDGKNSYSCFTPQCPNQSITDPEIIDRCEEIHGQKCYFFALNINVVWKKTNSQTYKTSDFYNRNAVEIDNTIDLMTAKELCEHAYDKPQKTWSTTMSAAPYVAEATKRGMQASFCGGMI